MASRLVSVASRLVGGLVGVASKLVGGLVDMTSRLVGVANKLVGVTTS